MTRTPEQLIEEAETRKVGKKEIGFTDDKADVQPEDISTLITAGAQVLNLNSTGRGPKYYHLVVYKGYKFISGSDQQITSP